MGPIARCGDFLSDYTWAGGNLLRRVAAQVWFQERSCSSDGTATRFSVLFGAQIGQVDHARVESAGPRELEGRGVVGAVAGDRSNGVP